MGLPAGPFGGSGNGRGYYPLDSEGVRGGVLAESSQSSESSIRVRGGVLAESSQSSESSIRVSCTTYRSNVHSAINHNDFEHFKRGKFDTKADDGYFLGHSFNSKDFRVFNIKRRQIKDTYHVKFDERMEAIRFKNTLVDKNGIDDSSRYPPNEFFHEDNPSRQYQENYDISYYIIPHDHSLTKLTQENHVPEVIAPNEQNIPHTEDIEGSSNLANTKGTQEKYVQTKQINHQDTKETLGNNTEILDRWSRDQHIELVNIISDPGKGMLTRSMVAKLTTASASECLFADFLLEIEPKKVFKALKHLGRVDAMQEKMNKLYRNKVWTLVPLLYGKIAIGSKWVFRNKKDKHGIITKNKARLDLTSKDTQTQTMMVLIWTKEAPRDPDENSSQSPPHIDYHCCYGCDDSLDSIFCLQCTCESCGNGAYYGYNCLLKVPIISNPEPCHNQNVDEFPQTLPSFHPTCYSEDENSFAYDSTPNFFDDSPNDFNPPSQPPTDSYEFCGNDAHYSHDCPPPVPFIYNSEPCYNQDFNFLQNFKVSNNNILVVKAVGDPHETFQSRIDEADCDPEEEIRLIEKLLYDNSSPRPLDEFNSENSDAIIESFSPSLIPVEDSDSLMKEIDVSRTPDDSMSPGIENDDYDSEGDILFLEELLSNDFLSLPENESFHFDIPSSPRPPAKPPDDDGIYFDDEPITRILTVKVLVIFRNTMFLCLDFCPPFPPFV
nr:hypothetical protein [Tanacetum cinerariifolium]